MKEEFFVKFWGVRGSFPVSGKDYRYFGGNTTCFEIKAGGNRLIFDSGMGIVRLGQDIIKDYFTNKQGEGNINLYLFFTHFHHDHTQGLPFFAPTHFGQTQLFIFGPKIKGISTIDNISKVIRTPFFPVELGDLPCQKISYDINENYVIVFDEHDIYPEVKNKYLEEIDSHPDKVIIRVHRGYNHPKSGILAYRIEFKNRSVVVATDVEGYVLDDQKLLKFSKGADLIIHDAAYNDETYALGNVVRQGWGHSTYKMACRVARNAEVNWLALTHHDPTSPDKTVRTIERKAKRLFKNTFAAFEEQEVNIFDL